MRQARLKPEGMPVFYHFYNRVAGMPRFFPFGHKEKEQFVRLLRQLSRFYTVKVVSYQIMSNHFHLIAQAPEEPPTPEEICQRYNAYYGGKDPLNPSDPRCAVIGARMRDISWFMHTLQQRFTTWYNRTRPVRRRGPLWADRFKHTLLGDAQAVWECCKYIEMNAVRAGIVSDPADYRFGSYGAWSGKGEHPFAENMHAVLIPYLQTVYPFKDADGLYRGLRGAFDEILDHWGANPDRSSAFVVRMDRRVRYWVDGLLIGSELFIQDMILHSEGVLRKHRKGPTRARGHDPGQIGLCSYRELRTI